ncbi:hypothetical protein [Streptomyces sp. CB02056]|uniref:hypothetical protein n=1 Tax=Streptomyces sp. CB02056 TaxID=1703924 RepID=UPI00093C0785|nr:hypothetical protein [Streptomyces sp. CB02056]OKH97580.1 hypothetical protein AMK13_38475 [Streptomyces sp. CB02056]
MDLRALAAPGGGRRQGGGGRVVLALAGRLVGGACGESEEGEGAVECGPGGAGVPDEHRHLAAVQALQCPLGVFVAAEAGQEGAGLGAQGGELFLEAAPAVFGLAAGGAAVQGGAAGGRLRQGAATARPCAARLDAQGFRHTEDSDETPAGSEAGPGA